MTSPASTADSSRVASTLPEDPAERVDHLRAQVNAALADLEEREAPALLYDPVRYVFAGGGKRLRPVLLLLVAEAFGKETADTLPAALAVEVFHNFTLVHDDIMDRASERRGRPSVHRRWDTGTALLSGDLLLVRAYDLLTEAAEPAQLASLMPPFHRMARRLCEGQAYDKTFETQPAGSVSVDDYLDMIDGKTGALLGLTFELGGRLGHATAAQAERLHSAGAALGRAFQIQDDLLDLIADPERWGKPVGGDLVEGKKTFLLLRALERTSGEDPETAEARALFERAAEEGLPEGEVARARQYMERFGVLEEAQQAVARHTQAASDALDHAFEGKKYDPSAEETVRWLIARMQARLH